MADDVQLTDLEVIQCYSLAVRGATASRADLVAALESDLAWLTGSSRRSRPAAAPPRPASTTKAPAAKAPARQKPAAKAPARQKPAAKAPARKAPAAKRTSRA